MWLRKGVEYQSTVFSQAHKQVSQFATKPVLVTHAQWCVFLVAVKVVRSVFVHLSKFLSKIYVVFLRFDLVETITFFFAQKMSQKVKILPSSAPTSTKATTKS